MTEITQEHLGIENGKDEPRSTLLTKLQRVVDQEEDE